VTTQFCVYRNRREPYPNSYHSRATTCLTMWVTGDRDYSIKSSTCQLHQSASPPSHPVIAIADASCLAVSIMQDIQMVKFRAIMDILSPSPLSSRTPHSHTHFLVLAHALVRSHAPPCPILHWYALPQSLPRTRTPRPHVLPHFADIPLLAHALTLTPPTHLSSTQWPQMVTRCLARSVDRRSPL
jgi:hypothetical protein